MATTTSDVKVVESEGKVSLEIVEPQAKPEITAEALLDSGLDPREVEMAKQNEIIPKTEDKKDGEKKEEVQKVDAKVEDKKEDKVIEPDSVEEKALLETLDYSQRGLYLAQKKERKKRQDAELERDFIKTKVNALEKQIEQLSLKNVSRETKEEEPGTGEIDPYADVKDDDVMTGADLKRIRQQEADLAARKTEEANLKNKTERARLKEFDDKLINLEVGARERYEDFDDTIRLAQEILADPKKVFGDNKRAMMQAITKAKIAIAEMNNVDNADPDYNSADISYELGQMHPKYKSDDGSGKKLSADKVDKIVTNANKRVSSASLTGGKRTVSADEITLEDVARMSQNDYNKLPKDVRERLLRQ